jgi:hypothetical protein
MSRWAPPFYGLTLTPEDKFRIHQEIFHLSYNSNGGFTHDEVYTMPVYLRYFNLKMLIEQRKKESEKVPDEKTAPKTISRPTPKK